MRLVVALAIMALVLMASGHDAAHTCREIVVSGIEVEIDVLPDLARRILAGRRRSRGTPWNRQSYVGCRSGWHG